MSSAAVPAHSKYASSKTEQFLACPGSIQACDPIPEPPESPYAAEGTAAHSCFERFTKAGPNKRLAMEHQLRKEFPIQMVLHAGWAYDQVLRMAPPGATIHSERKVSLAFIHKEFGGTLDISIVEEFGRLIIADLKYGKGLVVEPKKNLQLISYALAVAHEYDYNFHTVTLTIIQPRIPHPDGLVRSWTVPLKVIESYAKVFRAGIAACEKKNPKLFAGEHCRWCRAKETCKEFPNKALREAELDFENLTL